MTPSSAQAADLRHAVSRTAGRVQTRKIGITPGLWA